jgi:hypothetical protein
VRPASGVRDVTSWTGPAWRPERPRDTRIFSPETSWLVMDRLSDPEASAGRPSARSSPSTCPFRVAFKTGTTRAASTPSAIGATRELTVAAWGRHLLTALPPRAWSRWTPAARWCAPASWLPAAAATSPRRPRPTASTTPTSAR